MIIPQAIIPARADAALESGLFCGAQARIDLTALRHNFRRLHARAPDTRVMAMLKADAYGHGALHCARALACADAFAVARLSEAQQLREAGIRQKILLLPGVFSMDELGFAAQLQLDICVHQSQQLELLEQAHGLKLGVWLKINTGMNRLGFDLGVAGAVSKRLLTCPALRTPLRIMTHLADADKPGSAKTREQIQALRGCAIDGVELSIANSAGVLAWPDAYQDWLRPGISLYGVSPFTDDCGADHGLRPVMRFTTRLIDVKTIPQGGAVGYGSTWVAPREMRIGAAAVGYADGYPRHLPSGTPVMINDQRASLIGRVSMDIISLDLEHCPAARMGDEVLLWGPELAVEIIARAAGSIGYELVARVGPRVRRTINQDGSNIE
ncbi:MAG: alanine racemase [Mariprofundaceae bacterium]|nr:alanine racemase [Mariprofundaceae bacterium]